MKTHESKKGNLTWESLKNCELQVRFKLKILWVLDQTELLDSGEAPWWAEAKFNYY